MSITSAAVTASGGRHPLWAKKCRLVTVRSLTVIAGLTRNPLAMLITRGFRIKYGMTKLHGFCEGESRNVSKPLLSGGMEKK